MFSYTGMSASVLFAPSHEVLIEPDGRATHVPVGHDQQQHLEFARECATNFNHAYGPHLVHPETITRMFLSYTTTLCLLKF